jgi:hypothetical protein
VCLTDPATAENPKAPFGNNGAKNLHGFRPLRVTLRAMFNYLITNALIDEITVSRPPRRPIPRQKTAARRTAGNAVRKTLMV